MGIDTSIYQNLLRPPKSVAEYTAEAQQGEQNRLALNLERQKADQFKRNIAGENRLSQLLASGSKDVARELAGSGFGSQAMAYTKQQQEANKSAADIEHTGAQTGKLKTETAGLNFDQREKKRHKAITDIASFTTPQEAMASLQAHTDAGDVPPEQAAMIMRTIPQNPADFPRWQIGMLQKIMSAKDAAGQVAPDANAVLQARTSTDNNRATIAEQARGHTLSANSAAASRAQSDRHHSERLAFDKTKPQTAPAKPMPATALKMQQAELDAIGIASGIQADLGAIEGQIKAGKLDFGPVTNLLNRGRNLAGMSSEGSRNMASFKSSLEKLRNDSLRLNTGVQTDGDAQRAWNELFENINDKGVVTQRLAEIKKLNERAVNLRKLNVDGIRANYGRDPMDTTNYENQAPALGGKKASNLDALLDKYKD